MSEAGVSQVEHIIASSGFPDFRWTDGSKMTVAHWVRMKCTYACDSYARQACCPLNVPSVEACIAFFADYERIAVIRIRSG